MVSHRPALVVAEEVAAVEDEPGAGGFSEDAGQEATVLVERED
jgi:hypothetical protein